MSLSAFLMKQVFLFLENLIDGLRNRLTDIKIALLKFEVEYWREQELGADYKVALLKAQLEKLKDK